MASAYKIGGSGAEARAQLPATGEGRGADVTGVKTYSADAQAGDLGGLERLQGGATRGEVARLSQSAMLVDAGSLLD